MGRRRIRTQTLLGKGFGGFELSSAHVLSCIYLIARDQQGLFFTPQQQMKAKQRLKNKDELSKLKLHSEKKD
jgi:hypothetical protein